MGVRHCGPVVEGGNRFVCFTATASFAAAGLVSATGVATLALVRDRREVPLALLGIGFAAHQFIEGLVWLDLGRSATSVLRTPVVAAWLVFAWALLPPWVPLAVRFVEPDGRRRQALAAVAVAGAAVGLALGIASFVGAVPARVVDSHLSYVVPSGWAKLAIVPYVIVTLAPPLLSSHASLRTWGVALATSMAVTAILQNAGFASLWCFFAAFLSVLLLVRVARERWFMGELTTSPLD
jgi:hypothetical protein